VETLFVLPYCIQLKEIFGVGFQGLLVTRNLWQDGGFDMEAS